MCIVMIVTCHGVVEKFSEWPSTRKSEYSVEKYELIHFICKNAEYFLIGERMGTFDVRGHK